MRLAILAATTLALACGGKTPVPVVPAPPPPPIEGPPEVDSGTAFFFHMMQARLRGHTKLPDHEYAVCLYGSKRPLSVSYIRTPQLIAVTDSTFLAHPCEPTPDYLGIWHAHFPGDWDGNGYRDACWFSQADMDAQQRAGYVLALVTCGEGLQQKTIYRIRQGSP